jgi:molecular chaperone DnaK
MYLGIDLGTSNSAIVGYEAGKYRLFKTAEGLDVLPSAIMIDRRGNMFVGKRAYDQAAYVPEAVAQGFKRLMGTSTPLSFGLSGRTMTPEEASGEILKALVAQAKMAAGDFSATGAVITIPAAFNQMQTEATMRAAGQAALSKVALLQEPIAASMASIANSDVKSGQFLVYDLGGGTFDVAIVQSIAGCATVVAHAGINMLGGRDFDRALLNAVVRPWLLETFDLPENFQTDRTYQRLLRVAQYHCEAAKIALSTQAVDRIFADESQLGAKDHAGREIFLDIEVSREALDGLIKDDVMRSIELCQKLLSDNGYRPDDIDRVVMIGGPSRMPIVRESVSNQLGIRLDTTVDPMIAVATGAAIYADGRDWDDVAKGAKVSRASKNSHASLNLRFDYPARTTDEAVKIRVRGDQTIYNKGYRVVVDTDGGWTSGQIDLSKDIEVTGVPVKKIGTNLIRITAFDSKASLIPNSTTELNVVRALASSTGMPTTHTISVKVLSSNMGAERNSLFPLVKKGTPLPASGMEKFRAARNLRSGDNACLDFELFEQQEGVDDPNLNLPIGAFRLHSNLLERGDVVRKGDAIFVNWRIDGNGLLDADWEVPSITKSFSSGHMYVPTRDHKNFEGEDGGSLAEDAINSADDDISRLEKALGSIVSRDLNALQERLEKQRSELRLSHDADVRRRASEEARSIRQEVARIRNNPENLRFSVRAEVDEFTETASVLTAGSPDSRVHAQVLRLAALARDTLMKTDPTSIDDARRSLEEMKAITFADLAKQPGFWIGLFENMASDRHKAIDKAKHDQLVKEGERRLKDQDVDGLREITFALRENMVHAGGSSASDVLASLMR